MKGFSQFFLALLIAIACAPSVALSNDNCAFLRGDANGDGVVSFIDVFAILSYFDGRTDVVPCPQAADVNASGRIGVADALHLMQYLFADGLPPAGFFPERECDVPEGFKPVASPEQFVAIRDDTECGNYYVCEDIVFSDYGPLGLSETSETCADIRGNNFKIIDLEIADDGLATFFRRLNGGVTMLTFENPMVSSDNNSAAVLAYSIDGTVTDVHIQGGRIEAGGSTAAGLAIFLSSGTLMNVSVDGGTEIRGGSWAAGLASVVYPEFERLEDVTIGNVDIEANSSLAGVLRVVNEDVSLSNLVVTEEAFIHGADVTIGGAIHTIAEGVELERIFVDAELEGRNVGGIIYRGRYLDRLATIEQAAFRGNITASGTAAGFAVTVFNGIYSTNKVEFKNSYVHGTISSSGTTEVAGGVVDAEFFVLENSYVAATVECDDCSTRGGLAAITDVDVEISASFYDEDLLPSADFDEGAQSTEDLQDSLIYFEAGWDHEEVFNYEPEETDVIGTPWVIDNGEYPRLRTEITGKANVRTGPPTWSDAATP